MELAGDREAVGVDFAVAEECGQYEECGDYVAAFGDHVIVIEYTEDGLAAACAGWGGRLSVVLRDLDVLPADDPAHVRRTRRPPGARRTRRPPGVRRTRRPPGARRPC
nr:hypothetical protein GCM10017745_56010 [Saccharothrix mutabilis subsp. capreolus]